MEVDAGQEAHLMQWLSKRLGRQLVTPDLSGAGFRLMGGRLLPAEDGPAAQFMYENGTGERLTLYLRSGIGDETAFRYHEEAASARFTGRTKDLAMRLPPGPTAARCCASRRSSISRPPPMAPGPRSRPHLVSPPDCRGIKRYFGSRSERGMTCSASTTARYH